MELKGNPLISILMLGAMVVRLMMVILAVYLLLWIQSFARQEGDAKPEITRMEGKKIYITIMIIAVLISAVVFPIMGILCDHVSPKIIIPLSFIFRAGCVSGFVFMAEKPTHTDTYVLCILMVIGTVLENMSTDTLFYS